MLLEAIKTSDEGKALDWSKSEEWAIVEELIQSQGTLCRGVASSFTHSVITYGLVMPPTV